jgi:hypothetical protein
MRMLAADPADRPAMAEVRDELAKLAAGRDGDTTTVLLARTDIRSNAQGRARTASFPASPPTPGSPSPETRTTPPDAAPAAAAGAVAAAGAEPAASRAATASAVADRPPARPPAPPAPARGKRRRGAWIAAGLLALLLAGLVVLLVIDPFGGDGGSEAQESPSPTTSAAPSTTAEPSPTDDEAGETSAPSAEETSAGNSGPGNGDPLAASNIQNFLADYHQQVLSDPSGAYARTGPTLRASISEAGYVEYWSQFEDVVISDVQAVDGQNTATATQELVYVGGGSETSQRLFTFVVQDGQLILDSDFPAG